MPFPTPLAEAIARITPTCVSAAVKKVVPKKKVLLLHLDNSGSTGSFMNLNTIYWHEQERCKQYALERLNDGTVAQVYLSSWNTASTNFVLLQPTQHLITKKATGFSNWQLPEPNCGTTPSNAFFEAERLIKTLGPDCDVEYVIATDGTYFDGISEGVPQTGLFDACKRLMSLKNVSITIVGIIPQQVNYDKITESQPIPGLTLANLLFQYVSKCMMCSGNETALTIVFKKPEQTSSSGILFCNEFRLPHGTNIIAFLTELVKVVMPHSELITLDQYDMILDNVVSLCVLKLKGIINPLKKKVTWFEQVKSGMITLGIAVYLKADPTLTEQQVKDAVTEKFNERFIQVSQGSTRLCSGSFIQGKRNLFQEVGAQLKASGTLPIGAENVLFIVHDHTNGSYTFVRVNAPDIRQKLCNVQGMPSSGYNNSSLALPDLTDTLTMIQESQVIRQAIRGSAQILLPKFRGDNKDSVFIFMWGVEWVKGFLSGLPVNCDHMDILNLLFCTMANKKVLGRDGCDSTLLQEWKKGIFPERLDDGRSLLQIVSSPFLDTKGIDPHDVEGLLFYLVGVFDSFVKQEQCTLRVLMGIQHTPSCEEFLAYVREKYAHLKGTVSTPQDVPFYSHAPYSPFQQDYMDLSACGELWSVLPHTNVQGSVCDVKHQDGGFYCDAMERVNMMGTNGGRCMYCRMELMPCHFKKVEGGWPTLQTFLDSHIPVGPVPQPVQQPAPQPQPVQPAQGGGASAPQPQQPAPQPFQGGASAHQQPAPQPFQGGASAHQQPAPQQPARPQAVFTVSGGAVPPKPRGMSNNRNKRWDKYVNLYGKTGNSNHLDVLNKMVSEESGQVSTAP
jgi:hypothetical protein